MSKTLFCVHTKNVLAGFDCGTFCPVFAVYTVCVFFFADIFFNLNVTSGQVCSNLSVLLSRHRLSYTWVARGDEGFPMSVPNAFPHSTWDLIMDIVLVHHKPQITFCFLQVSLPYSPGLCRTTTATHQTDASDQLVQLYQR